MTIKQGDQRSYLRMRLIDKSTGDPVDLSGASAVYFWFGYSSRSIGTQGNCQVIDAVGGIVEYRWAPDDLVAGQLLGEVEVIWPGAEPQTFPSYRFIHVEVADNLRS